MKIQLNKNEKGQTIGWSIIAESKEDKLTLGSMRNLEFFGSGDDVIKYDGMKSDPEDNNFVIQLNYATKAYKKDKEAEFRASLNKSKEIKS
jgi:hypothetical protein